MRLSIPNEGVSGEEATGAAVQRGTGAVGTWGTRGIIGA